MGSQTPTIAYRIFYFPLTRIIIGLVVIAGLVSLAQMGVSALFEVQQLSDNMRLLTGSIVSAVVATGSYALLYRFYEKRKITELSGKGIDLFLFSGIALGAGLQGLTILVIYFKGGFEIKSVNPVLFIIPGLVMAFTAAVVEEVLIRGVVFRILQEKLGSYFAVGISAILFGLLHLGNPNATLLYAVGIALQAGCFLAAAYIYARNLWFPIAIHFAWNFTQGGIFGAAVSGNAMTKSLFTTDISGDAVYTGGAFGPEGSIQATIFCLLATVALMVLNHKDKRIIKPYWKQTS